MSFSSNTGTYSIYSVSASNVESFLGSTENLVVDNGLDLINTAGSGEILHTCVVSSDTSQITPTTNQIPGVVASTSSKIASTYGSSDVAPFYYWYRITFEFAAGAANGNLTKVGITNSSGSLFSVAMFKDPEGNPTTIQPMTNERLRVVYDYKVYINSTDVVLEDVKIFKNSDNLYKITIRPASINSATMARDLNKGLFITDYYSGNYSLSAYRGKIGKITSTPSDYLFQKNNALNAQAYTNGDYIKFFSISLGHNEFNHTSGISSLLFSTSRGAYQIQFEPPLIKNDTQIMNIKLPITSGR